MKRRAIGISITFLTIGGLLLLGYYYYGLFTPYNYFTAKRDISNGIIQIVVYGELRPNEKAEAEIAKKYGFAYDGTGCILTPSLISGIQKYNEVVYNHLDKINGKDWWENFQNERKENHLLRASSLGSPTL